jgi:hypothetical protein
MKPKTICDWNKSEIKENKKILFSLIKNPTYYCKKCARASNDESYLCKAEKISKVVGNKPTTND